MKFYDTLKTKQNKNLSFFLGWQHTSAENFYGHVKMTHFNIEDSRFPIHCNVF
jgi:hypothetical protein